MSIIVMELVSLNLMPESQSVLKRDGRGCVSPSFLPSHVESSHQLSSK